MLEPTLENKKVVEKKEEFCINDRIPLFCYIISFLFFAKKVQVVALVHLALEVFCHKKGQYFRIVYR